MNTPSLFTPELAVIGNRVTTTSTYVAKVFSKRHDNVMRDIKALCVADSRCLLNFEEASYRVSQPNGGFEEYPEFTMNRDGFMLLAMGFTGKKALEFKLAFVAAFNAMEAELLKANPKQKTGVPVFHVTAAELAKLVDAEVCKRLQKSKPALPSFQDVWGDDLHFGVYTYKHAKSDLGHLAHTLQVLHGDEATPAIKRLNITSKMLVRMWTMIDEAYRNTQRAASVLSPECAALSAMDMTH